MNEQLKSLAQAKARGCFTAEYLASGDAEKVEQEILGVLIAQHFEWDGNAIMETFRAALEDANFLDEASQVQEWINDPFTGAQE